MLTADGERISVAFDEAYDPVHEGSIPLVFVISHGFTGGWRRPDNRAIAQGPVSYTHLTLPTNREV